MEPNSPTTGSVNSSTEPSPKSIIFSGELLVLFKKRHIPASTPGEQYLSFEELPSLVQSASPQLQLQPHNTFVASQSYSYQTVPPEQSSSTKWTPFSSSDTSGKSITFGCGDTFSTIFLIIMISLVSSTFDMDTCFRVWKAAAAKLFWSLPRVWGGREGRFVGANSLLSVLVATLFLSLLLPDFLLMPFLTTESSSA